MSSNTSEAPASQETASLVTRLAGPSTGKAGLAKDQTEINRIIAEASKGSKFYDNEKKKDKDLTQHIAKILQSRDDLLTGVDIGESLDPFKSVPDTEMLQRALSAPLIVCELESQRDLSQTIVHVDMDAFYANVELLDNPQLAGKPFGVGHGVLSTASYEARKYGVRSGMPGFIAKKLCPELIFVPLHFSRYMDMSDAVMSVFRRYDPNLLAAGCDEAYLNITAHCKSNNLSPAECVQEMRKAVFEATKLTASAGIAPTKMLAKNKPNGQFELPCDPKSILSFLHELSIRKLIEWDQTCGDIFTHRATVYLMDKQFGSQFLFRTYLGVTSNVVQPRARSERKSIGAERTFSSLADQEKILLKLDEIAVELEKDMSQNGWTGRTVTLKFKLDTYQVFTRAKSFDHWVTSKEELFATGKELILPEFPLTIRLIGLRVTKLKDLRAPPEPANGIKRFFGPLQDLQPRKKAKIEHGEVDTSSDALDTVLDDAMPGFHEMDEADHEPRQDEFEDSVVANTLITHIDPSTTLPRIPGVTNTEVLLHVASTSASQVGQNHHGLDKPRSFGSGRRSVAPGRTENVEEAHDCPVCGKTLRTDNQGLNAHIDFCLSRGAIRQAHAEATSPVKPSSLGFKPISKGKARGK
ncbi:hypothetical protein DXG01_005023 [Tephrocybe rancida]|nr:hypothetical protein DXG01_005023 [Tephrocybe rancida]